MLEDIKENVLSRAESKKSIGVDSETNETHQKSLGEVLIEQHLKDPSFDMEEVKNQVTGILTGVSVDFYNIDIFMFDFYVT